MKVEDIYWHDAIIRTINIDRSTPGVHDYLEFDILWYDDTSSILTFEKVYWANFALNFGIVAQECILGVYINNEDDGYKKFASIWSKSMDIRPFNLYVIELNSTGGCIKVIAKDFTLRPL